MGNSKEPLKKFNDKFLSNDLPEGNKQPFLNNDDDDNYQFDHLMEEIGNDGKFQKRFNFLYNFIIVIFLTMPYLNIILAMTIPEHFCQVPGMEATNHTLEEWKEIWLPK